MKKNNYREKYLINTRIVGKMKTRQLLPLTPKERFTVLLNCINNINTANKTQSITLYGASIKVVDLLIEIQVFITMEYQ